MRRVTYLGREVVSSGQVFEAEEAVPLACPSSAGVIVHHLTWTQIPNTGVRMQTMLKHSPFTVMVRSSHKAASVLHPPMEGNPMLEAVSI